MNRVARQYRAWFILTRTNYMYKTIQWSNLRGKLLKSWCWRNFLSLAWNKDECLKCREMMPPLSINATVYVLLLSVECWAETISWGTASHLRPNLFRNPISLSLIGLNPPGNATMSCNITLRPHSVPQLSIPEIWQQSVEARVHRWSARSVSGVGFQGKVEQKTRNRGIDSKAYNLQPFLIWVRTPALTFGCFVSFSWRPVRAQSCWSSLRSTASSTTGTGLSQRPSTLMWALAIPESGFQSRSTSLTITPNVSHGSRRGSRTKPSRRTCLSLRELRNRTKRRTIGTPRRTEVIQTEASENVWTCQVGQVSLPSHLQIKIIVCSGINSPLMHMYESNKKLAHDTTKRCILLIAGADTPFLMSYWATTYISQVKSCFCTSLRLFSAVSSVMKTSVSMDSSDQKKTRMKLKKFLIRRPTYQAVRDKGYIKGEHPGGILRTATNPQLPQL